MHIDLESKFLSPERTPDDEIKKSFEIFQKLPYVKKIFDAVSSIAIILDNNRQIVYANKKLIDVIGDSDLISLLGLRPGELLHCKHAINLCGGCGTSEACRYCGAALSIKQSIEEAVVSENECRITVNKNNKTENLDLLVTSTPIELEAKLFIVLSIVDISNEKRRKVLERVFFHDVVNTAGGLKGILEHVSEETEDDKNRSLINMALNSADQLLEEILMHRTLFAAESGELIVKKEDCNLNDLLGEVREIMLKHKVANGNEIFLVHKSSENTISTDIILLKRILINLLKNALEASGPGEIIKMGYLYSAGKMNIFVHNNAVLSEEVKSQIFQRSFSTKGDNRGIGTYSIKILTETYLNGKVRFSSSKENGTEFTVELPLDSINDTE